jgi:alpha-N-arabinofuranosidase
MHISTLSIRTIACSIVLLSGLSIADAQTRIVVNADLGKDTISRHIYGHFSEHLGRCIYGGYYVGEGNAKVSSTRGIRNDVVQALKRLHIPNLRWPGGCFADTYHWKDGNGPKEKRPTIVNTVWGGVT